MAQSQQDIAKKLASLPPEKRNILIKLLKKQGIDPSKLPIIPTNRELNPIPLSWGQERLWFLDQFEENSATYNLLLGVTITGKLEINDLQKALNMIIQRHEVLRTNFQEINGTVVQIIKPSGNWPLIIENCQESEIAIYIHKEQQKPFNLATDSLVRGTLLKVSNSQFILLVTRHHIVWDGWSTGVFLQELSTIYQAYSQGKNPNLAPLSIQYADFSQWQRQWLTGTILEQQLNYWQEQLKNAPSLLQLPTDKPRPSVMTFNGKSQELIINQEISKKLQLLSRETGTTLFMTLLAIFATLLYRYSHQEDILIGSPIANRNREEIEPLIGCFVNTLVLRANFSENLNFTELLNQIKETTLAAYNHQDIPFEQIVDAVKVERSLSHYPLFQVMFILQNTPNESLELPDVTLTPLTLGKETTNFDLTLDIEPTEKGLVATWEYNSDLFADVTITRMLCHFENILTAILANPQLQINHISLLTEAERNQILFDWNNTQIEYPQEKCIHQLFEKQVEKTPEAVAVIYGNQQLTYRELNEKANQLANYLKTLGVKVETLVGICVERSLEMVIGLLGILKAGGAYVPIDPNYPAERIAYMLSDANVQILISQKSLLSSLSAHQTKIISLDQDWEIINQQNSENPDSEIKPKNLAYIIYTSGSTGKPKGVQIEHQGVVNFLTTMSQQPGITEKDTLNAVTTICFDIAGLEIYLPLIVGAKVIIVSREIATDGNRLLKQMQESGVTVMQATPATWQMLLSAGLSTEKLKIKVLCGGEALTTELANQLLGTGAELWNVYGPTETTIWSTVSQVEKINDSVSEGIIPIGYPIGNTQIYILDSDLQPVPIGVAGELHIGGAGLARGYLKRPELTAEKFIENPFNSNNKLYKTGDLARYLANGQIEYLGRIDNQVKVRGFRIELGEIEAVINAYPDVNQGVVISRVDSPGNQRLVAYLVTKDGFDLPQLRDLLKLQLPDYMIPATFVVLDSLPLTPNGKIDKKALPAPEIDLSKEKEFVPPQTPTEEMIANIFATVLNVQLVGIHDNFFELGGHSLLATQVISRLRKAFEIEIPLKELFAAPTVAQLSDRIESLRNNHSLSLAQQLQAVPTTQLDNREIIEI
ncbi:non-ribosomal peptide synthetase [Anabaena sp. UHCC 0204]|uniref:non-ribosomal peptide synthetase n=1 Tax=Anabaena sp. UHCC 0204 TaxID=2590009 RepID=UPI001447EC9D|nr:amino acid adenylation domain-containing protein [Anabaena sp. UHCC 0204]